MKHLFRHIILWFFIPLLLCCFLFRESILIYAAPRYVLAQAVKELFHQLETRFSGSPIQILYRNIDPRGCYDIDFTLNSSSDYLGFTQLDMHIQTQGAPARILSQGSFRARNQKFDFSLFFDDEFAAIAPLNSSAEKFYGISYDVFSQDLQQNSLLSALLGTQTREKLESTTRTMQSAMSRNYAFPDYSPEDLRTLILGVLALQPQVSSQTDATSGRSRSLHTVSFHATGSEIAAMAAYYEENIPAEFQKLITELSNDDNSALRAQFSLEGRRILLFTGELTYSGKHYRFTAELGINPATDPLSFTFSSGSENNSTTWTIQSRISQNAKTYAESITITQETDESVSETDIFYTWDRATEELNLKVNRQGREHPMRMRLHPTEVGFSIQSDHFFQLTNIFHPTENTRPGICSITVEKGSSLEPPEYLDFTQWTMEDTLTLLSGFGNLLGIPAA